MDILWIIIGICLLLIGIIGSVVPAIPGPPISYFSLLILQLKKDAPFSTEFLLIFAVITIAVTVLDYIIPIYGTKKLGGTKKGMWGSTIGLFIGLFLGPFGIIIGPFAGAVIGELIGGQDTKTAFKSGLGSFIGFVAGTLMKLALCLIIGYYFIINIF